MDNKTIEFWENHYLNQIEFIIKQDIEKLMIGLTSKDKIKEDWIEKFKVSANKNSDFARGAERILFWLFNQFGIPNSAPIGSDIFFETYNAFIHIDIKTAKIDNPSDYKGKIPVGQNQTSYNLDDKEYNVNLPTHYHYENKICLTYFINIIYDISEDNIEIMAVYLISVPNGKLSTVYSDRIYSCSKNKGHGFRYKFSAMPKFKLLDDENYRIRKLFLDSNIKETDILGFEM